MSERKIDLIDCYLQTLTPIHLGCDEVYDPMRFVLDEGLERLIIFEPRTFFQHMRVEDRVRFSEICKKGTIGSILQIYKFFQGRKTSGRVVEACPGLVHQYRRTMDLPPRDDKKILQELNNFVISRTAFLTGDERPYIPGSAIKGALRTAYLNYLAQEKKISTPRGKDAARDLEKILLDGGSFETDPFRLVKISDFMPVGEVQTRVIYAVNEKKKLSRFEARGPFQILEIIKPGATFVGSIMLEEPHPQAGIPSPVNRDLLFTCAAFFFGSERSRENRELADINVKPPIVPPSGPGFPIRLGRHSGAESITIEGYRNIKVMKARGENPEYLDHATTLWLAADEPKPKEKVDLKPFGWARVMEATDELNQRRQDLEDIWRRQQVEQRDQAAQAPPSEFREPGPKQEPVPQEVWEKAPLTWNPGNQTLTAASENRKATCQGKEVIPPTLQIRLVGKRKTITAQVTVEPIGNAFRIIKIAEN